MGRRRTLTQNESDALYAILRDRAGMDQRLAELDQQILMLDAERDQLRRARTAINDVALAEKFEKSVTTIHYYANGNVRIQ